MTETQASTGMHSSKMSHQHSSAEGGSWSGQCNCCEHSKYRYKEYVFQEGAGRKERPAGDGRPSTQPVRARPATSLGNWTVGETSFCKQHEENVLHFSIWTPPKFIIKDPFLKLGN